MSTRSYKDAVEQLNTLQSNAAALDAVRASGGRLSEFAIPEMLDYLERIGYSPGDLNALNVIHITGTKGKGSTSAFADSILRHAMPRWKIGLYTSPHLVAVRERIRINGVPISEEQFAKFFFEVWDRLEGTEPKLSTTSPMPGYFRFITLVAFHAFLTLQVNATVLEVGVGGTYDSTNIVPKPIVTGITALGIDHVAVLGKTLKEIAWQKGGIFKEGVPAFTVNQPEEGMSMLKARAIELKASSLTVSPSISALSDIKLGLAGIHQQQNATLAAHLVKSFLESQTSFQGSALLPSSFVKGLEDAKWPGRCQTVSDPNRVNTTWYLDGAHTTESLSCCVQWFVSPGVGLGSHGEHKENSFRVLIFNCTSGRSGPTFLGSVQSNVSSQLKKYGRTENPEFFFTHVIFCANVTYADGQFKGDLATFSIATDDLAQLKTQRQLASAWAELVPQFPSANIYVLPSIEHAVKEIEKLQLNSSVKVLVAGSLHLVGGVIEVAGLSGIAL
ncbi:Mur ligase [Collybia nuda]|uniref:Folylpolyglutamate synthase n=1 Tax=Collybia nuda TaxID=64659 RepID=A0A9P5Y8V5_9AGAR|nr:Mur ligase [Collybia nuda]